MSTSTSGIHGPAPNVAGESQASDQAPQPRPQATPDQPHKAQVVPDTLLDHRPYLAECSCGTQGRFREEATAYDWINVHLEKYDQPPIQKTEPPPPAQEGETTAASTSKTGGGAWEHRGGHQRK